MKSHGSASKWLRNQNVACWSGRGCQWRIHFEIFRMNILPHRFCGMENPQKFGKRNPSCRFINIYIHMCIVDLHIYMWICIHTRLGTHIFSTPPTARFSSQWFSVRMCTLFHGGWLNEPPVVHLFPLLFAFFHLILRIVKNKQILTFQP